MIKKIISRLDFSQQCKDSLTSGKSFPTIYNTDILRKNITTEAKGDKISILIPRKIPCLRAMNRR